MYYDAVVDYATVMMQSNDANVNVLTEPLNLTQLAHYKTTVLSEETHSLQWGTLNMRESNYSIQDTDSRASRS